MTIKWEPFIDGSIPETVFPTKNITCPHCRAPVRVPLSPSDLGDRDFYKLKEEMNRWVGKIVEAAEEIYGVNPQLTKLVMEIKRVQKEMKKPRLSVVK